MPRHFDRRIHPLVPQGLVDHVRAPVQQLPPPEPLQCLPVVAAAVAAPHHLDLEDLAQDARRDDLANVRERRLTAAVVADVELAPCLGRGRLQALRLRPGPAHRLLQEHVLVALRRRDRQCCLRG